MMLFHDRSSLSLQDDRVIIPPFSPLVCRRSHSFSIGIDQVLFIGEKMVKKKRASRDGIHAFAVLCFRSVPNQSGEIIVDEYSSTADHLGGAVLLQQDLCTAQAAVVVIARVAKPCAGVVDDQQVAPVDLGASGRWQLCHCSHWGADHIVLCGHRVLFPYP